MTIFSLKSPSTVSFTDLSQNVKVVINMQINCWPHFQKQVVLERALDLSRIRIWVLTCMKSRYKEINVIDRGSRIRIFYQKHWNFSLYLSSLTNPTKTQLNARCWRNSITFSLSGLLRWDFGRYTEIFLSRGPLDIGEVVNAAGSHCQQPTISFKSKQRDETKGKTYLSSLGFFTKTKRATNVKRR